MKYLNVNSLILFMSLLATGQSFNPKRWSPISGSGDGHYVISQRSLDRVAMTYLKEYGDRVERPISPETDQSVSSYCEAVGLGCQGYDSAASTIIDSNSRVDSDYSELARYHFDGESFTQANTMLMKNKQAVVQQINASQSFNSARLLAGTTLHTLQDFYSHSNWIEMNHTSPNRKVTRSTSIGQIAAPDMSTCSDCNLGPTEYSCENNILEEILRAGILTSGYYGGQDIPKPPGVGKCSHGGEMDSSQDSYANGGINKDVRIPIFSPHDYLQVAAVGAATEATYQIFLDFWDIIGFDYFGQFLGLTELRTAVTFVLDLTGEPTELGQAIRSIVDQARYHPKSTLITVGSQGFGVNNFEDSSSLIEFIVTLKPQPKDESSNYYKLAVMKAIEICGGSPSIIHLLPSSHIQCNELLASIKSLLPISEKINFKTNSHLNCLTTQLQPTDIQCTASSGENRIAKTVTLVKQLETRMAQMEFLSENELFDLEVRVESSNLTLISVQLYLPTGQLMDPTHISLPGCVSYLLQVPQPGQYTIKVDANSSFSVLAQGLSELDPLIQVGKYVNRGDHGLEGFVPFQGEPVGDIKGAVSMAIGSSHSSQIEVDEVLAKLIGDDGSEFDNSSATGDVISGFIANVTIPMRNFRVLFTGRLQGESRFQRTTARLFDPVPFIIASLDSKDDSVDSGFLQVNIPLNMTFGLFYLGDKDEETFQVEANDNLNLIKSVEPSTFKVTASNRSHKFVVTLFSDNATLIGSVDSLRILAVDPQGDSNYLLRQLAIMPEQIDIVGPQFADANYDDSECPNVTECHGELWRASVSFSADQNGLHAYKLRVLTDISAKQNSTFQLEVENFVTDRPGVVAKAEVELDCCLTEFEVIAIDSQGNLNAQYFSNILNPDEIPPTNGLEWWVILLIVVAASVCLVGVGFGVYRLFFYK